MRIDPGGGGIKTDPPRGGHPFDLPRGGHHIDPGGGGYRWQIKSVEIQRVCENYTRSFI